jgi:hypothetical protein
LIERYLGRGEGGPRVEISVVNSQNSGARHFMVTVKDTGEAPSAADATAGPELDPAQFMMYSGTVQYVPAAEAAPAAQEAPTNVYDAYWATQPPEVQALRHMQGEAERTLKAHELAAQGFAIDVPIMVWQWDPFMTMRARELAGYTWVPSANNAPVELGPGIAFPGLEPYDPANPPVGAIPVTTEWAKGLEHTSIWWRPGIFAEAEATGGV